MNYNLNSIFQYTNLLRFKTLCALRQIGRVWEAQHWHTFKRITSSDTDKLELNMTNIYITINWITVFFI